MRGFDLRRRSAIDQWLEFVGPATARGVMYDLGSYPGVLPGEGLVTGELYWVADASRLLARVDAIEGFRRDDPIGSLYVRAAVCARRPGGGALTAWLYFYNRNVGEAGWISHGDYLRHIANRHPRRPDDPLAGAYRRHDGGTGRRSRGWNGQCFQL